MSNFFNQGGFDASEVTPTDPDSNHGGGGEPLPGGWYAMTYLEDEEVATRDTIEGRADNWMLAITFEVDDAYHPEYSKRRAWENLNLKHAKPNVQGRAWNDFGAICVAAGKPAVANSGELHGRKLAVRLGIEKGRKRPDGDGFYPDRNQCLGFDTIENRLADIKATASAQPASTPAPSQRAASTQGGSAVSNKPWARKG